MPFEIVLAPEAVEDLTRLPRVRLDALQGQLLEACSGQLLLGRPGRDESPESATQPATTNVHSLPFCCELARTASS